MNLDTTDCLSWKLNFKAQVAVQSNKNKSETWTELDFENIQQLYIWREKKLLI